MQQERNSPFEEKPGQGSSLEVSKLSEQVRELDQWIEDRLKSLKVPAYAETVELNQYGEMAHRINNEEDIQSGTQQYAFLASLFASVDELRKACLKLESIKPALKFTIREDRVAGNLVFQVLDTSKLS